MESMENAVKDATEAGGPLQSSLTAPSMGIDKGEDLDEDLGESMEVVGEADEVLEIEDEGLIEVEERFNAGE